MRNQLQPRHKAVNIKGMPQRIKRFLPNPGESKQVCSEWSSALSKYMPVLLHRDKYNKLTLTAETILNQKQAINKAQEILSKYGLWVEARIIINPDTLEVAEEKIYLVHHKQSKR